MSFVQTLRHDDIHELRLARPPVNALDPALCTDLLQALDTAVAAGARGLLLSGGPKVFSGGLDVPYLLSLGTDQAALQAAWQDFFEVARRLAACPVPVVAAIAGHAPAGGCVLALCCDYRVMAQGEFRIGLNETQVGLIAPEGIQALLARAVGAHRAALMLMEGRMVDAAHAHGIGLVDALAPAEAVVEAGLGWLQALLRLPQAPMLETRRIARAALLDCLREERIDLTGFVARLTDADTQAGLRALMARLGK